LDETFNRESEPEPEGELKVKRTGDKEPQTPNKEPPATDEEPECTSE
jgi:hypothetical protein